MNKPAHPWPYTGRTYPDGAKLVVVNIHEPWLDLLWEKTPKERVYLSTLAKDKYPEIQIS